MMNPEQSISQTGSVSAAFQGEPGAFSFQATQKLLGVQVHYSPKETFTHVFQALENGEVEYGVIPIENTLYGSVHENYDHLLKYGMSILGETTLRISHSLLVPPWVKFEEVRRAFSHPVALAQCRNFFEANPVIVPVPYYDTAGSIKMLMQEHFTDAAAVASEQAGELYGAQVLRRGIEDNSGNFTRFFLLTKQESSQPVRADVGLPWKTSVVFSTLNIPGALSRALTCFSSRQLNLIKLESRPLRDSPWEYLFYLDISGSTQDSTVAEALEDLKTMTVFQKVLGSYCPTV